MTMDCSLPNLRMFYLIVFVANHSNIIWMKIRFLQGFVDKRMIQVAAGYNHCLALADVSFIIPLLKISIRSFQDGTVYALGVNDFGQLGLGNTKTRKEPTPIICLRGSPIVFIACGGYHSLIISKSGYV